MRGMHKGQGTGRSEHQPDAAQPHHRLAVVELVALINNPRRTMRHAIVSAVCAATAWSAVAIASGDDRMSREAQPWEWTGGMPADVVFVKGKKVAGTTVGGIMRRLGQKHGIDFFSPKVPARSTVAWRSGGRERWILEQFADFAASSSARHIAWAQEQTLSPMRAGLKETSKALASLAKRAWRVTVIREPFAHALSACTHFGPCAVKRVGHKQFTNTTAAARMAWIDESLGPAQMWRFITPEPSRLLDVLGDDVTKMQAAARSAVNFYHAVLIADDLDASLVALAISTPGLDLTDVLYIPAKTTHTERRPAVGKQPDSFVNHLQQVFYAGAKPQDPIHTYADSPKLAPDTQVYLFAKARLEATVHSAIGKDRFERELHRFRKMQSRMLAVCGGRHQNRHRRSPSGANRSAHIAGRHLLVLPENGANSDDREATSFSSRLLSLPAGIPPKAARECLYGDQGCGYRCIDAWVADRGRQIAARRDAAPKARPWPGDHNHSRIRHPPDHRSLGDDDDARFMN